MNSSIINRCALRAIMKADSIMTDEQMGAIAPAMSLLSEYVGGYRLFGEHLENTSSKFCLEVLREHYQSKRRERDRKATGRHYTPKHLCRDVAGRTLKPIFPVHLAKVHALPVEQQLSAILDFHICDPAAGSGNFLVQVAREIGVEVARILFRSRSLDAWQVETGMLLATQNCIYGVDKDPLAVELCKLALWLNATKRQQMTHLPLPTLPNIRCGDSLVGVLDLAVLRQGIPDSFYKPVGTDDKAIAAALRKQNKQERSRFQIKALKGSLQVLRDACDVYTAACFIRKLPQSPVPTTATLEAVLNQSLTTGQQTVVQHCRELSKRLQFFHWVLEFPEIFLDPKSFAKTP